MTDDVTWADRGQYWQGKHEAPVRHLPARGKRVERAPLVLTGHGVRLQVQNGALLVRDGFTHYPQPRRERRFFPGDRALPSRVVVLDGDGVISFDVIAWLSRQHVPLLMLDWQGEVVGAMGDGVAPDRELQRAQLDGRTNGVGLRLATWLIREKVASSLETLRTLPLSPRRDKACHTLEGVVADLDEWPPETIETLRLVEGRAALAYFRCWQSIPLSWKGTGRKPIPLDWHRAGMRQSFVSGSNRHATHPVNAMLNYAYAALEGQVRISAVAAGLDPTLGFLHARHPGRVALVYDLMEPLRPRVDRLVLDFVQRRTFGPADVLITERGVCRLHPQLARTVAGLAVSEKMVEEVIATVKRDLARV